MSNVVMEARSGLVSASVDSGWSIGPWQVPGRQHGGTSGVLGGLVDFHFVLYTRREKTVMLKTENI